MSLNLLTSNQFAPSQRKRMNSSKTVSFACLTLSVLFGLGRPGLAEPPAFSHGPTVGTYAVPDMKESYKIDSNVDCPTASLTLGGYTGNGNDWANSYAPYDGSFSSSAYHYGLAAGIRIPLNSPLADFCKEYALRKSQFAKISTENYQRNSFLTNLEQCRWLNDQGIGLKENSQGSTKGTSLGSPIQYKDGMVQDRDVAFMRFCQQFAYDLKDVKLKVRQGSTIQSREPLNGSSQSKEDNGNSKNAGSSPPKQNPPPSTPAPQAGFGQLTQPTPIKASTGQTNNLSPDQSIRNSESPQAPIQNFSTPNAVLQLQRDK
jgi:hypothetical protein